MARPDWSSVRDRPRSTVESLKSAVGSLESAVFGDRTGLAIWLGLVLGLATTWRVGFFLTDTYTVANTLANVADGRLAVTEIYYSISFGSQPGLHEHGGRMYGRNYGQVMAALPVLWLLEGLALLAPPRVVLAAGFSIGVLAFGKQVGTLTDRPVAGSVIGAVAAFVVFVANVGHATPLGRDALALVALQASTLFAAALAGVLVYRTIGLYHDRSVAVSAGVAIGAATPVGFWATLPKRHVLVTTLVLATVYCFARSRRRAEPNDHWFRGLAYGVAGLIAWIHAFEGFFVLAALAPIDLLTTRSNDRTQLSIAGLGLLLGLVPMVVTNVLISGNPLAPPRLLSNVGLGDVEFAPVEGGDPGGDATGSDPSGDPGGDATGNDTGSDATGSDTGGDADRGAGDGTSGSEGSESERASPVPGSADGHQGGHTGDAHSGQSRGFLDRTTGSLSALTGTFGMILGTVLVVLEFAWGAVEAGLGAVTEPDRLWQTFVRSGRIPAVKYSVNQQEAIELTVLETAPVLGVLVAAPIVAARRWTRSFDEVTGIRELPVWLRNLPPRYQTDLLVGGFAATFTIVYLPLLPLHSQITVRYLLPVFALGVYAVARLEPIQEAVRSNPGWIAGSWLGGSIAWSGASVGILAWLGVAVGEAVQFHALASLAAAAVVAGVASVPVLAPRRGSRRTTAVVLGLASAVSTVFILLSSFAFFPYGPHALDAVRVLAEFASIL